METKNFYCPDHKKKLELRKTLQDKHKGEKFYGCPTWSRTKCKYTIPYKTEKKSALTIKERFLNKIKNIKGKISSLRIVGVHSNIGGG